MGAPRQIKREQLIHEPVFEAMGIDINDFHTAQRPTYTPSARFHDGDVTWNNIRDLVKTRLEADPFASATSAMKKLGDAIDSDEAIFDAAIQVLKNHVPNRASSVAERSVNKGQVSKALAEVPSENLLTLLLALEREVNRKPQRAEDISTLCSALVIVPPAEEAELKALTVLRNISTGHQVDEPWKSSYREVVRRHGNKILEKVALSHLDGIESVLFSDNEELVFAASSSAVETWDHQEQICKPAVSFQDCDSEVLSIHISKGASQCVTGHEDGSVRLWSIDTGRVLFMLQPEENAPQGEVAISPDSSKIASGSSMIRIWDTQTRADITYVKQWSFQTIQNLPCAI
ncbi:hypothetical protein EYR36_006858 [Pleurotus pulmonarius]|nr:hypothetical protein EYR36_006858 [Pleurotus pulmonarius]